jgi:hypothetical protein
MRASREEMLEVLRDLGPAIHKVRVNGRAVTPFHAIRLVQQLPLSSSVGCRGEEIFIDPDPFAGNAALAGPPNVEPTGRAVTRRLLARQRTRMAVSSADGLQPGWLRRVLGQVLAGGRR